MSGIRRAFFFASLAGQIFGNNPIWHFDGPGLYSAPVSWVEGLDSEGGAA